MKIQEQTHTLPTWAAVVVFWFLFREFFDINMQTDSSLEDGQCSREFPSTECARLEMRPCPSVMEFLPPTSVALEERKYQSVP